MAIIEKEVKPLSSKEEHELVSLFDSGATYYQRVGASGTSRLTAYPRMTSHEVPQGQAKRVYPRRRYCEMKKRWILGTLVIAALAATLIIIGVHGAWADVPAAPVAKPVDASAATLVVTRTADFSPRTLHKVSQDTVNKDAVFFGPAIKRLLIDYTSTLRSEGFSWFSPLDKLPKGSTPGVLGYTISKAQAVKPSFTVDTVNEPVWGQRGSGSTIVARNSTGAPLMFAPASANMSVGSEHIASLSTDALIHLSGRAYNAASK